MCYTNDIMAGKLRMTRTHAMYYIASLLPISTPEGVPMNLYAPMYWLSNRTLFVCFFFLP